VPVTTAVPPGEILQFDLLLKQGADITVLLTVVDGAGAAIMDPSGWVAAAQIRAYPGGPVLFEWSTTPTGGQGQATLAYNPTTGVSTLSLTVTKAQSSLFTWSAGLWDCYLTDPSSGLTGCVCEGTVAVNPAITL
jgi:hypothetical protein